MKIIRDTPRPQGKRRVTIELDHNEEIMTIREGGFYQLGGQVEDIVGAHVLTEAKKVTWCSIEQRWTA